MLEHGEALRLIDRHAEPLEAAPVFLADALGRVLARDVKARLEFPHFDNSAVDGFALGTVKNGQKEFRFRGEIPAGCVSKLRLKPGEAMAIFTGAPVPGGAGAVVMQEYAERRNGSVLIREMPEAGENIRRRGEDFGKGERLLEKGICLGPQHAALLAALGYLKVPVLRRPEVAILSTGSELVSAGEKLKTGQIYDSNTPLLALLVRQAGAVPFALEKTRDGQAAIRQAIRQGLGRDVLIVCGGVSVGKYDFVKEALRLEGVREIFWKINIKPGKPVFFGKKGRTLVFGLPGNPVSVFVTFQEFVKPALLKMMGKKSSGSFVGGTLTAPFQNGSRPHFIRVLCRRRKGAYEVTPLKGQGSHQIGTLARANGILKINPGEKLRAGQKVDVHLIQEDDV